MTKDEIMTLANQTSGQHWMDEAHIQRFAALVAAAERQRIEAAGTSLYERTGDIADINTLLIQRNEIRARGNQ